MIFSLSVLAVVASAASIDINNKAFSALRGEVASYKSSTSSDLCTNNKCCTVANSSNSCSLASLPYGDSTLVLPGGDTRCIFSYSTPYAFQVIPGNKEKVVFYFQGGGACWDEYSTKTGGFCTTDCSPQSRVGVFDNNNLKNQFKDHTIIHALYCSGDVWTGDVVRNYTDNNGIPVVQKGLANAQSVLDWAVRQQQNDGLAPVLDELVIMGCSAGSIGAQIWSNQVTAALKWKKASVVPDSYAALFPPGTEGGLIYDFGFCNSGFISDTLTATCKAKELTMRSINMELMTATPSLARAFIQSKADTCQMSFYMSVGMTAGIDANITPAE